MYYGLSCKLGLNINVREERATEGIRKHPSIRPFFIKFPHRKEGTLTTDKQLLVRDTVAMLISISYLIRLTSGVILTIDVTRQFMSK
jgi:hypothetical protein